jgi:hydrogenase maturation factor
VTGGCDDAHCVTCSDEGVPMRVLGREARGLARCLGEDGSVAEVMTDLVGRVDPGDVVLVHAGVALALVDEPEPAR